MKFLVHDPYPTLDEMEEVARQIALRDATPLDEARDRAARTRFDQGWDDIWSNYGATLDQNIMT